MNKPTKPNIVIPESFAENGIKTDFDNEKLTNGFDRLQPDVLAGDNLNKFIDDTYKGLNYGIAAADAINLIQEGETLTVQNGQLVSGSTGGGLEVCDIGMALYVDETKGLRRYLNGQIVDINANTQAFLDRLKQITTLHPSLLTTEDEWQTAKTLSKFGQVGKFVFNYADDGVTVVSVRIPRVVNIQGLFDLQNLGITVAESLPNIKGTTIGGYKAGRYADGCFKDSSDTNSETLRFASGTGAYFGTTDFNASNSSSTYQDNAPVQQEAIQYPYFIQIATGAETENNIINEIELNNPLSLLDYKYSEYELNNISWLRSNGQYNTKIVYPAVYDLLLKIYNGTETKAGVSVKLWTDTSATDYDFKINTAEETFMFPTKVKLASGKAVVGNGLTLGLTNGTNNYGLGVTNLSDGRLHPWGDLYGANVGSTKFSGTNPAASTGITTDPTKSGIETSDSGLYLYFYVGETVQNANLIDAGRIGESLTNKVDLSNTKWATNACMPDYSAGVNLNWSTGQTYTVPYDCEIRYSSIGTSPGNTIIRLNNSTGPKIELATSATNSTKVIDILRFNKGTVLYLENLVDFYRGYSYIYPLKGAN